MCARAHTQETAGCFGSVVERCSVLNVVNLFACAAHTDVLKMKQFNRMKSLVAGRALPTKWDFCFWVIQFLRWNSKFEKMKEKMNIFTGCRSLFISPPCIDFPYDEFVCIFSALGFVRIANAMIFLHVMFLINQS